MKRMGFFALLGSTALASATAFAQTTPAQPPAAGDDCTLLVTFLERPAQSGTQPTTLVTVLQAKQFQQTRNDQACKDAIQKLAQAGQDVRQAQVQVQPGQQPGAQIQVRQQPPEVTVRQAMPEILVRQPPPMITVELPQPEIIVRMPQPEVNVATAQPQVEIKQAEPRVNVIAPGQSQVQVQREGQPQVRYEQTGEPQVQFKRAEGQPQIRFEQAAQQPGQQPPAATPPARQASLTDEQRRTVRERLGVGADRDAARTAQTQTRAISYSDLENMVVYNARNERLGEVEQVLIDPKTNKYQVVVGAGGFLGIGESMVAFPAERFWVRGDRLYLRGVSEDEVESMNDYRDQTRGYRRVTGGERGVYIAVWPS